MAMQSFIPYFLNKLRYDDDGS